MRRLAVSFATGLAFLALTSAPAAAAAITFNFGHANYAGANGDQSHTEVNAEGSGFNVTLTSGVTGSTLTHSSLGIGIESSGFLADPEDDEIGRNELLFSGILPSAPITGFTVANFYRNEGILCGIGICNTEHGEYSVDGGATWIDFVATDTNLNGSGFLAVSVNAANTGNIRFQRDGAGSEFSLYNLTIETQPAAVPEPASMLLLGSGLVGGIGALRRRKAKATK